MYAVIKTGGKQYRVSQGDVILVEKLAGDPGQAVEFDQVLMMDDGSGPSVGAPLVDGARVAATVLDQAKADKVLIFKKKRRKNYRRLRGHRQNLTVLRVTDILAKGQKASPAKAEAPKPAKAEAPPAPPAETPSAEAAPVEAAAKKPAVKKAAAKKPAAKKAAAKKAPAKKAAKKAPAKKKAAKKKPS